MYTFGKLSGRDRLVTRNDEVLSVLIDNLLQAVHSVNLISSWLTVENKVSRLEFWNETAVSSAYSTVDAKLENLGRSFTKTRNSSGPRQDPCGTPTFSGFGGDKQLPIRTT